MHRSRKEKGHGKEKDERKKSKDDMNRMEIGRRNQREDDETRRNHRSLKETEVEKSSRHKKCDISISSEGCILKSVDDLKTNISKTVRQSKLVGSSKVSTPDQLVEPIGDRSSKKVKCDSPSKLINSPLGKSKARVGGKKDEFSVEVVYDGSSKVSAAPDELSAAGWKKGKAVVDEVLVDDVICDGPNRVGGLSKAGRKKGKETVGKESLDEVICDGPSRVTNILRKASRERSKGTVDKESLDEVICDSPRTFTRVSDGLNKAGRKKDDLIDEVIYEGASNVSRTPDGSSKVLRKRSKETMEKKSFHEGICGISRVKEYPLEVVSVDWRRTREGAVKESSDEVICDGPSQIGCKRAREGAGKKSNDEVICDGTSKVGWKKAKEVSSGKEVIDEVICDWPSKVGWERAREGPGKESNDEEICYELSKVDLKRAREDSSEESNEVICDGPSKVGLKRARQDSSEESNDEVICDGSSIVGLKRVREDSSDESKVEVICDGSSKFGLKRAREDSSEESNDGVICDGSSKGISKEFPEAYAGLSKFDPKKTREIVPKDEGVVCDGLKRREFSKKESIVEVSRSSDETLDELGKEGWNIEGQEILSKVSEPPKEASVPSPKKSRNKVSYSLPAQAGELLTGCVKLPDDNEGDAVSEANRPVDDDISIIGDSSPITQFNFEPVDKTWQKKAAANLGLKVYHEIPIMQQTSLPLAVAHPSKVWRVKGDGNCFFRCISSLIVGDEGCHLEIREKVSEFLGDNKAGFIDLHTPEQRMNMWKPNVWATGIELFVTATLLQTDIVTYVARNAGLKWVTYRPRFETTLERSSGALYLANNRYHFEPVLEVSSQTAPHVRALYVEQPEYSDSDFSDRSVSEDDRSITEDSSAEEEFADDKLDPSGPKFVFNPIDEQWRTSIGQILCCTTGNAIPLPVIPARELLLRRCRPLRKVKVKKDANCFFRCVSKLITGDEENHLLFRHQLVQFIRDNTAKLKLDEGYIKESAVWEAGVWAKETDIEMYATLLQTAIQVYRPARGWKQYTPSMAQLTDKQLYLFEKASRFQIVMDVHDS